MILFVNMASLSCGRALAGRPFAQAKCSSKPRRGPAPLLARRDSYMVEVSGQGNPARRAPCMLLPAIAALHIRCCSASQGAEGVLERICRTSRARGRAPSAPRSRCGAAVAACALTHARVARAPQVEIAEDEPEDVAVRRYMKAVMQSGVINKVRRHLPLRARGRQRCAFGRCRAFDSPSSMFANGTMWALPHAAVCMQARLYFLAGHSAFAAHK